MTNGNTKVRILDIDVSKLNRSQVLANIQNYLNSPDKNYIVTPNPEFLLESKGNELFKNILNNADLAIADGIGLLWASKFLSLSVSKNKMLKWLQIVTQFKYSLVSILFYPKYIRSIIPERITGSDLIWDIIKIANDRNKRIYLLGAQDGIAQMAAQKIKDEFSNIKIAGAMDGSPDEKDDIKITELINLANPDIIFVAYGAPKQEKWIYRNLDKLKSVQLAMGVGGSFDFMAGKITRAPKIMRSLGLEWLYRLFKEPKRSKRIYNATVKFSLTILKYKINNSNN